MDAKPHETEMIEQAKLPALIDAATTRLAKARSSGELLEARALGLAALHYANVTQAAAESQADCLRLVVRSASPKGWFRRTNRDLAAT